MNLVPLFICSFQIIGFGLLNMIYLYGISVERNMGLKRLANDAKITDIKKNMLFRNTSLVDFVHIKSDSTGPPARMLEINHAKLLEIEKDTADFSPHNQSISLIKTNSGLRTGQTSELSVIYPPQFVVAVILAAGLNVVFLVFWFWFSRKRNTKPKQQKTNLEAYMRDYISALETTLELMQNDLQQKVEEYSKFVAQGPGMMKKDSTEYSPIQSSTELAINKRRNKVFYQHEEKQIINPEASPVRSQLDTLYESELDDEEDETLAEIDLSAIFNEVKQLQTAETDRLMQNSGLE